MAVDVSGYKVVDDKLMFSPSSLPFFPIRELVSFNLPGESVDAVVFWIISTVSDPVVDNSIVVAVVLMIFISSLENTVEVVSDRDNFDDNVVVSIDRWSLGFVVFDCNAPGRINVKTNRNIFIEIRFVMMLATTAIWNSLLYYSLDSQEIWMQFLF